MLGGRLLPLLLLGAGLVAGGALYIGPSAFATMPFNLAFDAYLSSPVPSANSNLRFVTSLPLGNHALGGWSAALSTDWDVNGAGTEVQDGDLVGQGTMSVDVDCNGSVENFGPFHLFDAATLDPPDAPLAQWEGQITSWWDLVITADDTQPFPGDPRIIEISAPLNNLSEPHTLCAPQDFRFTVFGVSSPSNDVVLVNPNSPAGYDVEGNFGSLGGAHIISQTDSVCIGNSCDYDGDGVADITDNCDTWANASQALPTWLIPTNDHDCDGFSTPLEDYIRTNALAQCGVNAWPADTTNNGFSDTTDIANLTTNFGLAVPPVTVRYNLAPDPPVAGGGGFIDTSDIAKMTAVFGLG